VAALGGASLDLRCKRGFASKQEVTNVKCHKDKLWGVYDNIEEPWDFQVCKVPPFDPPWVRNVGPLRVARWEQQPAPSPTNSSGGRETGILPFFDGEVQVEAILENRFLSGLAETGPPGSSFLGTAKEVPQSGTSEEDTMEKTRERVAEPKGNKGNAPPVAKFVAGGVRAMVWVNEIANGGKFKSVTLERGYKKKDESWGSTTSLRANDLPKAILVLKKAYEYVQIPQEGGGADGNSEESRISATPDGTKMNELISLSVRHYMEQMGVKIPVSQGQ